MRLFVHFIPLAAALGSYAAAQRTVPPGPGGSTSQAVRNTQVHGQPDPQNYARRLFARFHERIFDVEEHRSGPGYPMLSHVTLYERPETSSTAGLCQVRVHDVGLPQAAPPADPARDAMWVRTSTRWLAIGKVDSSVRPADQPSRCARLPSARNFFVASQADAALALQTLTDAHLFAARMPRAISFACTAYQDPCRDPSGLFRRRLTPDRLAEVVRVPCEAGRPGRGEHCFRYRFRALGDGIPGDWSVEIKGPGRPLHVIIRQQQSPVV